MDERNWKPGRADVPRPYYYPYSPLTPEIFFPLAHHYLGLHTARDKKNFFNILIGKIPSQVKLDQKASFEELVVWARYRKRDISRLYKRLNRYGIY